MPGVNWQNIDLTVSEFRQLALFKRSVYGSVTVRAFVTDYPLTVLSEMSVLSSYYAPAPNRQGALSDAGV